MLKKLFNRKRSDTPVIDRNIIPQHVAIIMDGNGRWAKRRGMPRSMGHRAGADVLKQIVIAADDIGIRALTVYGFSTENWKRPEQEVSLLMALIKEYLNNNVKYLNDDSGINKIMALAEAYPELKANENFKDLSNKPTKIEDDIANSRKYYNGVVRIYNNKVEMFPSNIFAGLFGYKSKAMFEASANERENVKVEL